MQGEASKTKTVVVRLCLAQEIDFPPSLQGSAWEMLNGGTVSLFGRCLCLAGFGLNYWHGLHEQKNRQVTSSAPVHLLLLNAWKGWVLGMKLIALIAAGVLVLTCHAEEAVTTEWKHLLQVPVDDEWQEIFGTALNQTSARPEETVAQKIHALQMLISRSSKDGQTIPIYLEPAVADLRFDALPMTPEHKLRTGVPLSRVEAIDVFRHIAGMLGLDLLHTDYGLILRRSVQRKE
jgi:hypothetical protein